MKEIVFRDKYNIHEIIVHSIHMYVLLHVSMMQARLKAHWSVGVIRDEVTLEKVGGARMVVFGCPRDKFSVAEVTNEQGETLEEISIKDTCFSPVIVIYL